MRSKLMLLFMAFALVLALPATAFADVVKSEVANGVGSSKTVTVGETTTVKYFIQKTGGDCDANGATVHLKVIGGQSGDVTFTQSQQFTGCGEENSKTFSFTANKAGTYSVEVDRVADLTPGDGYTFGPAAFKLIAGEAAPPPPPPNDTPTVSDDAVDVFGNEGSTIQNSGSFSDANGDALTITKTGAGTLTQGANGSWSWSLATTDNGSGSVTVTADDGKGGTVSDSFDWTASNVAPTAQLNAPTSANEGSSFNVSLGNVQDAGSADTHEYRFDCGSGYGQWGSASSTSCAAGDGPGSLTVNGEVRDDDGGSNEYSASVTVDNVAPTATKSFASAVDEGTSFNLALTNATDASAADRAAGFTYAFNCGDGTGYGAFGSSASADCATTDDDTRSVGAKIRDKDGDVSIYTGSVAVNNVAPTLSALTIDDSSNGVACLTGNSVGLRFSFSDPGADTFNNSVINWGDGTTTAFSGSPVSKTHSYSPGTYTINVTVRDDDGGSDTESSAAGALSFAYKMSGILSPINSDGTSVFKSGSTIPVKVKITDCANTSVGGLQPTIKTQLASSTTPTDGVNEPTSTSGADTGGILRYDASAGQYIYNMSSTSIGADQNAKYRVLVQEATSKFSASQAHAAQIFGLRTK
jgi:hypothetical protein